MASIWPKTLWIIRHGESAANAASQAAEASGSLEVALVTRDMDTRLSPRGEAQATALGKRVACYDQLPTVILASPYVRTRQTAALLCAEIPDQNRPRILYDERLRERERGVFDGLTKKGVAEFIPQESAKRAFLGKFYHRAPGGESWCDVVQRLRAVVDRVLIRHPGERVMIIAHEVVIYCLRYILEDMDEAQILAIDAQGDIANCSVTEYQVDMASGGLGLVRFNDVG
jgi:broad specificity phosphatase PhoE